MLVAVLVAMVLHVRVSCQITLQAGMVQCELSGEALFLFVYCIQQSTTCIVEVPVVLFACGLHQVK